MLHSLTINMIMAQRTTEEAEQLALIAKVNETHAALMAAQQRAEATDRIVSENQRYLAETQRVVSEHVAMFLDKQAEIIDNQHKIIANQNTIITFLKQIAGPTD